MKPSLLIIISFCIISSSLDAQRVEFDETVEIRKITPVLRLFNTLADRLEGSLFTTNGDLNVEAEFDDLDLRAVDDIRVRGDTIIFSDGSSTPRTEFTFHHNDGVAGMHGLTIENNGANNNRWGFFVVDLTGDMRLIRNGLIAGTFAPDGVYTNSDFRLKKVGNAYPQVIR